MFPDFPGPEANEDNSEGTTAPAETESSRAKNFPQINSRAKNFPQINSHLEKTPHILRIAIIPLYKNIHLFFFSYGHWLHPCEDFCVNK